MAPATPRRTLPPVPIPTFLSGALIYERSTGVATYISRGLSRLCSVPRTLVPGMRAIDQTTWALLWEAPQAWAEDALVGLVFGGRWQARLEYMPVAQVLLVPPRDLLGPSPMKLTWLGHSAFRIEAGAAKSLIDPFLSDNPSWDKGWSGYLAGKNSTQGGDR